MIKKTISKTVLCLFFLSFILSLSVIPNNHSNQAQAASATFYPNYHPESTSVDGLVGRVTGGGESFTAIRSGAGTESGGDLLASGSLAGANIGAGVYTVLDRSYFLFDTSSLPSDAVIDSATLSLYVYDKANWIFTNDQAAMTLVAGTPASNTALVPADYALANFGTTRFASDILYNNITINQYNTFTLNASGRAAIGKGVGGMSKFGSMFAVDLDNGSPPSPYWTWAYIYIRFADYGDHTTYAPKLIVTYHIPPPAQVTNLHHTGNTASTISWDWDDTPDATGYRVYRASDNVQLADVASSNWDQGSLSPNVQSTVYVKAYNAGGEGTASANASAYTSANPPSSPGHSGNTTSGITWTWQVNSNPAGTQFYASDSTGNSGWSADAVSWNASSGHTANTQYTGSVKAKNRDGDETSTVTANAYTSIESVTGATFSSVTTDSINITGTGTLSNLSSGSSGIYFRESVSGTNSGWLTTNSWTRDSLNPNTQYHFYITTKNGDGEANTEQGPYDKYTLAAPAAGVLAIPGWDSNPAIGNYIAISWNILSATTVRIRCLNTGTDIYTGAWSPYVHTNLLTNTLYTYRIYSRNGEGIENPSYVQVSATTPPDQPQNLVLTELTANTATVTWNQVAGATGYILSYGTDTNAENIGEIIVTGLVNTTYTFQNLTPGTRYYVKVRATTDSLGAWSNIITFQTEGIPPSPSELLSTGTKVVILLLVATLLFTVIYLGRLSLKR